MPLFSIQKSPTLFKNWNLQGIDLLIEFGIDILSISFDFGRQLGLSLAPKMCPRRLQVVSKTAPKTMYAPFFAPAVIFVEFRPIVDGISIVGRFTIDFRSILDW